jgi:hypothetical protein
MTGKVLRLQGKKIDEDEANELGEYGNFDEEEGPQEAGIE